MRKSIMLICILAAMVSNGLAQESKDPTENLTTQQSDEESPKEIRCGRILVRGSEQLTQPELCRLLDRVSENMPDTESRNSVQDSIIKEYRRRGYLDATLAWGSAEQKTDTAAPALILTVTEGPIYRLRRLEMMGNSATPDRVIRRRVALNEDAPFDEELLE